MPLNVYFYVIYLLFAITVSLLIHSFVRRKSDDRGRRLFMAANILAFVWLAGDFVGVFKFLEDTSYAPIVMPIAILIAALVAIRARDRGAAPVAYHTVFETIRDGVLILDGNGVILDINPSGVRGTGLERDQLIGREALAAFAEWPAAVGFLKKMPTGSHEFEVDLRGKKRFLLVDSVALKSTRGDLDGRVITVRDITGRLNYQKSLEAMAFHDPLTRVANRRKFEEEVERAIKEANDKSQSISILYIDLNRFKQVNDSLGHAAGDELLKYVAARMASILRKPDIVARLGGDEFGVLLHKCDESGVEIVVDRIIDNVSRPFKLGDEILTADLSIGAAVYPKNGANLTELLRIADAEMYRAKQAGGGFISPGGIVRAVQVDSDHATAEYAQN